MSGSRRWFDHWIPTGGMSDSQLAEQIRQDGIDILVDLAGHTQGNRLLAFARKPAPVSVTTLGFGCTTGLSAIDWFLTDAVAAPEGCEHLFSEKPWRTSQCAVYRPAESMGVEGDLPAAACGYVTFGTLTRGIRINYRTIAAWAEILRRMPGSRLRIDSSGMKNKDLRASLLDQFTTHGISERRLELGFHSPPWDILRSIDITLDCFPHNSGTTLYESLYMGVPVVTLGARPSVGRLGSSIVSSLGYASWIATSEVEYVDKAVALASDVPGLRALRSRLRGQMQRSPLMDESGYARRVEAAYRGMWREWCNSPVSQ